MYYPFRAFILYATGAMGATLHHNAEVVPDQVHRQGVRHRFQEGNIVSYTRPWTVRHSGASGI